MNLQIIIADYKASNKNSFLAYLDALSAKRKDGGLHGGHIHYIQGKMGDFTSKAAISSVLDLVPDTFPLELPELAEKEDYIPSDIIIYVREINKNLRFIPIQGYDVVEIIQLAREYAEAE